MFGSFVVKGTTLAESGRDILFVLIRGSSYTVLGAWLAFYRKRCEFLASDLVWRTGWRSSILAYLFINSSNTLEIFNTSLATRARFLPDKRSRKLMNFWAVGHELKVSKSDIWLFCIFPGNAILVISRNARASGTGARSRLLGSLPHAKQRAEL